MFSSHCSISLSFAELCVYICFARLILALLSLVLLSFAELSFDELCGVELKGFDHCFV